MPQTILVTGACGYIGAHTCVELLAAGYRLVALDNLSNGSREALRRVERLGGRAVPFVEADVRDRAALDAVLAAHPVEAVIHFAGLKAVAESLAQPLRYYQDNVAGSVALLEAMAAAGVKRLLFSSSATVYGDPAAVPVGEAAPLGATNPYGRSKLMVEQIIGDLVGSTPGWRAGVLRYFNPVGAHASGLIGEDPRGVPANLLPFIAQVAAGRRERLTVHGGDYPTADGTGVRDYIHVADLARGHTAALARLFARPGSFTLNLGTGRGHSVLEVVRAFERASGRPVPYRIAARRPGDVAACYAAAGAAHKLLGWRAQRDLHAMCADLWRWQSANPDGYAG
ncbi:UDP-glucose 4-epimerase GalE [Massilia glaciei]|uniref:UDP-glucose 4-epimerase n=1 Tax=Massilia glaciei TaxID=1524097 RepID=A0A2U2HNU8_9BURK|nr:UDP-glucose 4-epimerase GalE [Massilia glaciei]PWF49188.1 UDP-glucose 4-epimerase GalE [Massilia glaciei]